MREFIDDDDGFIEWLETNPDAYVLNTTRNPTVTYLLVHRAICGQLRRRDARQVEKTRGYIKVCAPNVADLQQWADHHFLGHPSLTHCRICKP